ncbi:PIN domain-containing protein [Shouchella shacheensis]|uniref:PIN domain-containing protein n=1 Tax=Shouchella shacheensis TaxID=1649580 RepID=UPI0007404CF3|nr:type II toxin-antitoxin system VapC family toxin [Shouchella shacheensis]
MIKFLVDTNVLIRLIVKDDESKFNAIVKLVKKIETNEMTLIVPTIVIAECCWLLKSFYKLEKHLVSQYLIDIIESENVEAEEDMAIEALRIYSEKNVDFADALLSVKCKRNVHVLTWDKKDFKSLNCEFLTPIDLIE